MLMQLLTVYLWVALFTALSILWEWPFTGSKANYRELRFKLDVACDGKREWPLAFLYIFVLLLGTLLWPILYWYRIKDIYRSLRS